MMEGEFLRHDACEECGSSDAKALYTNGSTYCFSCEKSTQDKEGSTFIKNNSTKNTRLIPFSMIDIKELEARQIPYSIAKKYNYGYSFVKGKKCQVANYYNTDRKLVAQKLRFPDKTFGMLVEDKEYGLFGQNLFKAGGLKITITEGEIDALSVSTAFDGKYPVVSIGKGSNRAHKELAKHFEYINSFGEIYLWFDNDEAGHKAIEKCITLFDRRKLKIITAEKYKDANEVLIKEGRAGILNAFYNALDYKPKDIKVTSDLLDTLDQDTAIDFEWFLPNLNKALSGRRRAEVISLGAGVSIGKTDFITSQIAFDIKKGYKVGLFALEQTNVETVKRICGKIDKTYYHLPDQEIDKERLKNTAMSFNDNLFMYDGFGSNTWSHIKEKITYMVHNYKCEIFYLDNLTALNSHAEDERRNLDSLMAEISTLAKDLNIWILVVSHLNPPKQGVSHESGGKTEQSQFTGSRSIMRWSYGMLGLERNTTSEDAEQRRVGQIRILKDRLTGNTGVIIPYKFKPETNRFMEVSDNIRVQTSEDDTNAKKKQKPVDYF